MWFQFANNVCITLIKEWAGGIESKFDTELLQVNVAAAELECGREPLFDDGGSGHDNDRDFSSGDLDGVDRCCDWNWFRGKWL